MKLPVLSCIYNLTPNECNRILKLDIELAYSCYVFCHTSEANSTDVLSYLSKLHDIERKKGTTKAIGKL